MLAFFVPFFDPRRPLRLLHLDLLVLLSFSISHVFFNRGEIFTSVPLVYPVLVYLLVRMLMLARVRAAQRARGPPRLPFLLVPATGSCSASIFLVGFRVGLNVTNSNVIDVGYSGVIGADRITRRDGPVRRLPRRQPLGRHVRPGQLLRLRARSSWRSRGRARGTTCRPRTRRRSSSTCSRCSALFLAGRLLRRGPGREAHLGLVLAYAWAAFPYTLFVLNSNANDSLVALLVTVAFLALLASARARRAAGARRSGEVRAARARAAVGELPAAGGCATRSPSRSRSAP